MQPHATLRRVSLKEVLLRRVLRRCLVRVSIETEVLRRVLRRGGCYRRRLEGAFAEYDPLRVRPTNFGANFRESFRDFRISRLLSETSFSRRAVLTFREPPTCVCLLLRAFVCIRCTMVQKINTNFSGQKLSILGRGRSTVGKCTGPKWSEMVQTTILVKMPLFRTGLKAFARPKWTKMVHFGPFWPEVTIQF